MVIVLIIMNTILVSVIDRIPEIGTIRALGGHKSFILAMFVTETLTISLIFGIIGIVLAGFILNTINLSGIPADYSILQIMLGGSSFHPLLSAGSVIGALFTMIGIALVSSLLYPVLVALRVEPVKAIQES